MGDYRGSFRCLCPYYDAALSRDGDCDERMIHHTIAGVQPNFRVSYPICVIMRVKCLDSIAKIVQIGSNNDQCYIQNCVVTSRVIKRSRIIILS